MKKRGKKKRGHKLSKTASERIHALKRFNQRYGECFSKIDISAMVKLIQSNNGIYLEKQSNRKSKILVNYKEKQYIVIYDNIRKMIITVLPEDVKG